jgi:O2-independent ubiquinone biosynthesis protein UbiV
MRLALGPVLYAWPRRALYDFYERAAESPADTVYLGEVVCARRRELRHEEWLEIASMLAAAGKQVVLSTLALMETEADLRALRKTAGNDRFMVEANDMGAVAALAERGVAFVGGPHLNVYNAATLGLLVRLGARRWVTPVELSREGLAQMLAAADEDVETEVLLLGRAPLSFSARCFTSRRRGLEKDNCGVACLEHPDGLPLATREGGELLVVNGVQLQSFAIHNLVAEIPALRELGVASVRVSPGASGTLELLPLLRQALDGTLPPADAAARVEALLPAASCNGYWHGKPGMARVARTADA